MAVSDTIVFMAIVTTFKLLTHFHTFTRTYIETFHMTDYVWYSHILDMSLALCGLVVLSVGWLVGRSNAHIDKVAHISSYPSMGQDICPIVTPRDFLHSDFPSEDLFLQP